MDQILQILLAIGGLVAVFFGWKAQKKALHYRKRYLEKVKNDATLDPGKERAVEEAKSIYDRLRSRLDDPRGSNGSGGSGKMGSDGGTEDKDS